MRPGELSPSSWQLRKLHGAKKEGMKDESEEEFDLAELQRRYDHGLISDIKLRQQVEMLRLQLIVMQN